VLELLVVLFVLGVLVALLLPAVSSARESSRRLQCKNNLRQFGIATAAYESAHGMFPPGGAGGGASTHVVLLPYIDQGPVYDVYTRAGDRRSIVSVALPVFACPSESAPRLYTFRPTPEAFTSYCGNCGTGVLDSGYNGMFRHIGAGTDPQYPEGPIRAQDVRDGLSQTALASELLTFTLSFERLRSNWHTPDMFSKPGDTGELAAECEAVPDNPTTLGWRGSVVGRGLPWVRGELGTTMYNHVLTPNRPSCFNGTDVQTGVYTSASLHSAGVHLLFADGHCDFASNSVDAGVWRSFGSRIDADVRF